MTSTLTIITVTYNSVEFLEQCLTSVRLQRNVNVEHVIIDGLSTDGTLEILQNHSTSIAALVSEPDCGAYDAMNKGIAMAHGDIIGFLNSDDFYAHDQVLANVLKRFDANPELDACYADLVYVRRQDSKRVVRYWKSGAFGALNAFEWGWSPPHPTFFVRRSVYERLGGFNLSYSIAADIELMMRLLAVSKIRVEYVPAVWVNMRTGGISGGNLRDILRQNKEVLVALRSHGLPVNPVGFCLNKMIVRARQYLRRLD